jgi:hypothetical protein
MRGSRAGTGSQQICVRGPKRDTLTQHTKKGRLKGRPAEFWREARRNILLLFAVFLR